MPFDALAYFLDIASSDGRPAWPVKLIDDGWNFHNKSHLLSESNKDFAVVGVLGNQGACTKIVMYLCVGVGKSTVLSLLSGQARTKPGFPLQTKVRLAIIYWVTQLLGPSDTESALHHWRGFIGER